MAYEFKKLSDVAAVETPADTANVLIEEGGVIKKVAKESVGETSDAIIGKITTVDTAEEASDTANVLVEDGGALKKVPVGSVCGGIKTAIITDNWYDATITGAVPPGERVFTCSNMVYEEAKAVLDSGEPLDVFYQYYSVTASRVVNTHAAVVYFSNEFIVISSCYASETASVLFWSADGLSLTEPATTTE